jgi:hypothetical protein
MPWFSGVAAGPMAVQLLSFPLTPGKQICGLKAKAITEIKSALTNMRDLRNKLGNKYKYNSIM